MSAIKDEDSGFPRADNWEPELKVKLPKVKTKTKANTTIITREEVNKVANKAKTDLSAVQEELGHVLKALHGVTTIDATVHTKKSIDRMLYILSQNNLKKILEETNKVIIGRVTTTLWESNE